MHYIYTDASVRENESTHGYLIFDSKFNFVCGKRRVGKYSKTSDAERYSIKVALNRVRGLGAKKVTLFTDCISCISEKDDELLEILNHVKVKFEWISRDYNKLADLLCRTSNNEFFEKYKNILEYEIRTRNFTKPNTVYPNHVNSRSLSIKQKEELKKLLFILTNGDSKCLTEFFKWSSNRFSSNTYYGRRYLVKQFVEYKYLIDEDSKKEMSRKINRKTLLNEYVKFTLDDTVYDKYKTITRKNKQVEKDTAKRKLFRNMKLSRISKRLSDDTIEYSYGTLKMLVKDNVIIDLEVNKDRKSSWKINLNEYKELNSLLNLA